MSSSGGAVGTVGRALVRRRRRNLFLEGFVAHPLSLHNEEVPLILGGIALRESCIVCAVVVCTGPFLLFV